MTDQYHPKKFIRRPGLQNRTGLSRSGVYAKLTFNPKRPTEYDPSFPKPVKIGARAVGWVEAEIDAWMTAQIQKRGAA